MIGISGNSSKRQPPRRHPVEPAALLGIVLAAAMAVLPQPVQAQTQEDCLRSWSRPVVCQLRVEARGTDGRWRRVDSRRRLQIPAGGGIDLRVEARDQNGWRFPEERLQAGIDLDRDCRDIVHLVAPDTGHDSDRRELRYRLVAGASRGRCEAILWIPGNMNLDTSIRLEVVSRARTGYTYAQSRTIARRLYLGMLGREPDPAGWNAATLEIQRGRLKQQVHAMAGSRELRARQRKLSPSQFLEELYRGLLNREPDTPGVRTYLRRLERGQTADVVLDIIHSEEFEKNLLTSSQPHAVHDVRPPGR